MLYNHNALVLGSPNLKRIHEKFLLITDSVPMKIITFVETNSTVVTAMKFNFLLVEPHSGNPGIGEYFEVPQDHLSICKPLSRYSFTIKDYFTILYYLFLLSDILFYTRKFST